MQLFYLAPFVWGADGPEAAWTAPPALGRNWSALEMRPRTARVQVGGQGGYGVFWTPAAVADERGLLALGDDPDGVMRAAARQTLGDTLGVTLSASRLAPILAELLTTHAAPDGVAGPGPIMPKQNGRAALTVGDVHHDIPWQVGDAGLWPVISARLQADYRRRYAERAGSASGLEQKMLGALLLKYGLPSDEAGLRAIIPADLPLIDPVQPETTITDTFVRADAATLGTSSGGWSWSDLDAGFGIGTNRARLPYTGTATDTAVARADSDLSSDDHYAQVTLNGMSTAGYIGNGLILRKDSSATNTFYHARAVAIDGSDVLTLAQLYKFEAGSPTQIGSDASFSTAYSGVALYFEVNGSALVFKVAGTTRLSETNGDITGNVRVGLRSFILTTAGATAVDGFEAQDLVAGGTILPQMMQHYYG